MLRMVPLLLRNAYGSPVPGRSYFAFNYRDICIIPEIALCYDRSGQPLLRAFAALRDVKWMHRLREWNLGAVA